MSTILIRPNERSVLRKVTCDCKQPADCDNILCHTLSANYLIGKAAPNYPVPAIQTIVLHKLDGIELHRNLPDERADGVYYYWPH